MAKHTITIEDMPDGRVRVVSDPPIDEVRKRCETPSKMTSADGYAAEAHVAIQRAGKRALADLPAPSQSRN